MDAFADGQIGSKLWLCEELEKLAPGYFSTAGIWVLGGWYGFLSFLLFARGNLAIRQIRSFDIDEQAVETANLVNKNWEIQAWKFRAFRADVNRLDYQSSQYGEPPQIVINTSCEHFDRLEWWKQIPSNCLIVLQSTDMSHRDHVGGVTSLTELSKRHPMTRLLYQGTKEFIYPNRSFRRFMMIGFKG